MAYLYTDTKQGSGIQTGLSTQILVQVDGRSVGAIQTLSVQQQRPLKRVTELGTDGTIEIVPEGSTTVSLQVNRIVFDRKRMPEAFSRGFLNIHAQRIPFDIKVYDFQGAVTSAQIDASGVLGNESDFDAPTGAEGVITHVYENCWFESLNVNYDANSYIIVEDASIQAEFVHTFKDTDQPASSGEPAFDDALERLADVGRRGSLDARGLGRVAAIFGDNF